MELILSILRGILSFLLGLWGSRDLLRVVALGLILAVTLSNEYFLKRLERYRLGPRHAAPDTDDLPLPYVSILVPARNEELNIEACVLSLLGQEYPHFEVVVVDDASTDRTASILSRLAAEHERLRVMKGRSLPDGWLGKHWACHQLADASQGDLMLFTDADTRHHPHMLRDAVAAHLAEDSDLLTGLPHEETKSWGEILVMPIISWAMCALLPVGLAHRVRSPLLSAGIGQFMLFRRSSYLAIGGFEAVRTDPVDDMALARRVKSLGLRWRFVDLSSRVRCRMYQGFRGMVDGLSKSVFPALRGKIWVLAILFLFFAWVYLGPIGVWLSWLLGLTSEVAPLLWATAAIGLALACWTLVMRRFGYPLHRALFYPATILLIMGIAVRSALQFWRGEVCWKGRTLPALVQRGPDEEEWSADPGRNPGSDRLS